MEHLLSNVTLVADALASQARLAKASLIKGHRGHPCAGDCLTQMRTCFCVIRSGSSQVAFTCQDEAIATGFNLSARLFEADMIGMILDGIELLEGTPRDAPVSQAITFAIDREMNTAWQILRYDLSPLGLLWELPEKGRGGKETPPPFLAGHVFDDMAEALSPAGALPVPPALEAVIKEGIERVMGPQGPNAPETRRAFMDVVAIKTLEAHALQGIDYGVCSIQLMSDPGTPRGAVLNQKNLTIDVIPWG